MPRIALMLGLSSCLFLGVVAIRNVSRADTVTAQAQGVELKMAVAMDSPTTTIDFTLDNQSAQNVSTTPVATNRNRIRITTPSNHLVECFVYKDMIPPVIVSPKTSKTWSLEMSRVFDSYKLTAPGIYKIQWEVDGRRSAVLALRK